MQAVDFIVEEIVKDPQNIVENLKRAKNKLTPGAKDSWFAPTPIREPSLYPSRVSLHIEYS